jgi:hypothetical protein
VGLGARRVGRRAADGFDMDLGRLQQIAVRALGPAGVAAELAGPAEPLVGGEVGARRSGNSALVALGSAASVGRSHEEVPETEG